MRASLGINLIKIFDYFLDENTLNRVLGLALPTDTIVEPTDKVGAGFDDITETTATENEIYFCKIRQSKILGTLG